MRIILDLCQLNNVKLDVFLAFLYPRAFDRCIHWMAYSFKSKSLLLTSSNDFAYTAQCKVFYAIHTWLREKTLKHLQTF